MFKRCIKWASLTFIWLGIVLFSFPVIMDSSPVQRLLSGWISTEIIQGLSPQKIRFTLLPTPGFILSDIEVTEGMLATSRIGQLRVDLSPIDLFHQKSVLQAIYLKEVTVVLSDSTQKTSSFQKPTSSNPRSPFDFQSLNTFIKNLNPTRYAHEEGLHIYISNLKTPWFDNGFAKLFLSPSISSETTSATASEATSQLSGEMSFNNLHLESLSLHDHVTICSFSSHQIQATFSLSLHPFLQKSHAPHDLHDPLESEITSTPPQSKWRSQSKLPPVMSFDRTPSSQTVPFGFESKVELSLANPSMGYTILPPSTGGGPKTRATTNLGMDHLQATVSIRAPHGSIQQCSTKIHCRSSKPPAAPDTPSTKIPYSLSMAYQFDQNTSDLTFSGSGIDIEKNAIAFKDILPKSSICQNLFDILRAGFAETVSVRFSPHPMDLKTRNLKGSKTTSAGQTILEKTQTPHHTNHQKLSSGNKIEDYLFYLFNPETMHIEGHLLNGTVAIPGTDLVAGKVLGDVVVENGILKGIVEAGLVEQATIQHGGISVGIIDLQHPYEGIFDLSTDLARLHKVLRRLISHRGIVEGLRKIKKVKGKATGTLMINGDRNRAPAIHVNAHDIALECQGTGLPAPLSIKKGSFQYRNSQFLPWAKKDTPRSNRLKSSQPKALHPTTAYSELPPNSSPSILPSPGNLGGPGQSGDAFGAGAIQFMDLKEANGQLGQSKFSTLTASVAYDLSDDTNTLIAPLSFQADKLHIKIRDLFSYIVGGNLPFDRKSKASLPATHDSQHHQSSSSFIEKVLHAPHTQAQGAIVLSSPQFIGFPSDPESWHFNLNGVILDSSITGFSPLEKQLSGITLDFSLIRSESHEKYHFYNTQAVINQTRLLHFLFPNTPINEIKLPFTLTDGEVYWNKAIQKGRESKEKHFDAMVDFGESLQLRLTGQPSDFSVKIDIPTTISPVSRKIDTEDHIDNPPPNDRPMKHESTGLTTVKKSKGIKDITGIETAHLHYKTAPGPIIYRISLNGRFDTNVFNHLLKPTSPLLKNIKSLLQEKRFTIESAPVPSKAPSYLIKTDALDLTFILDFMEQSGKALNNKNSKDGAVSPQIETAQLPTPPTLTLETNTFTLNSMTLSPFKAHINFNGTKEDGTDGPPIITIDEMRQCRLNPSAELVVHPDHLDISLALIENNRDIEPIISCFYQGERLMQGKCSMTTLLKTKTTLPLTPETAAVPLKDNLEGTLGITSENGRIFRLTLLSRLLSLINVSKLMAGHLPDLEQHGFAYDTLQIEADVKERKIFLKKAVINGLDMTLIFMGWIDPFDKTMELTCLVAPFKTADSIIKHIPILGKMLNNRLISIPIKAWGPIHDPKLMILHPSDVGHGLINAMESILTAPFEIIKSLPLDAPIQKEAMPGDSDK